MLIPAWKEGVLASRSIALPHPRSGAQNQPVLHLPIAATPLGDVSFLEGRHDDKGELSQMPPKSHPALNGDPPAMGANPRSQIQMRFFSNPSFCFESPFGCLAKTWYVSSVTLDLSQSPLPQDSTWAQGLHRAMGRGMRHGALCSWVRPAHAGIHWDICGPRKSSVVTGPGSPLRNPSFLSESPLGLGSLCYIHAALGHPGGFMILGFIRERWLHANGYSGPAGQLRHTHHTAHFCCGPCIHASVPKDSRSHGPLPPSGTWSQATLRFE